MEPVIETKGLKHVYIDSDNNPVTAVDGIDLQIMPGEFVTVIGANGSGKSTLARHFNALLLPSEGSVNVHGLDTLDENNLWQIRQDTGMVFQNPDNQIVAAVVEEDVAFGPENIGVPTEELKQRVEYALRAVDMLDYREHAPHLLSGGQRHVGAGVPLHRIGRTHCHAGPERPQGNPQYRAETEQGTAHYRRLHYALYDGSHAG